VRSTVRLPITFYFRKNDIIQPIIAYVFLDPTAPVLAKTQILQALLDSLNIELVLQFLPWQEVCGLAYSIRSSEPVLRSIRGPFIYITVILK